MLKPGWISWEGMLAPHMRRTRQPSPCEAWIGQMTMISSGFRIVTWFWAMQCRSFHHHQDGREVETVGGVISGPPDYCVITRSIGHWCLLQQHKHDEISQTRTLGVWICSLMWYCICLFVGCKNCASILKMYITLNNRKPEKSARLGPSWRCNCRPVWHTCAANINIHIPTFKLFLKKFNLNGFWYQLLSSHFSLKQCAAETSTLQFLFV